MYLVALQSLTTRYFSPRSSLRHNSPNFTYLDELLVITLISYELIISMLFVIFSNYLQLYLIHLCSRRKMQGSSQ